jgi:hypothetical protein
MGRHCVRQPNRTRRTTTGPVLLRPVVTDAATPITSHGAPELWARVPLPGPLARPVEKTTARPREVVVRQEGQQQPELRVVLVLVLVLL